MTRTTAGSANDVASRTDHTVGIIGAGTMGVGGAHAFAEAGYQVTLVDTDPNALAGARHDVHSNAHLYGLLRKGVLVDPDGVVGRIAFHTDSGALSGASVIIENATENWDIKRTIYRDLDAIISDSTVIGVNTSAIPITRIGSLLRRPENVCGTHLMNPVPLKGLVEVIRGVHTSEHTIDVFRKLFAHLGKGVVVVEDSSGFVTNRVAMLSLNEAILLVAEGISTPADIDYLFRGCLGHQMGPLETADLIGLDTVLYSLNVLLDHFQDQKFRPAPLLKQMVAAGYLGKKSGKGFYQYAALTRLGDASPFEVESKEC